MSENRQMSKRGENVKKLADWFSRHVGIIATAEEIADEMEFNRSSFSSAYQALVRMGWEIHRPNMHTYVYTGHKKPPATEEKKPATAESPKLYEFVAQTASGKVLVKGDDGNLYVLAPFDL